MAMGTRKQREKQEGLWIAHTELATAPGHPFYQKLNELLEAEGFDEFVEQRCAKFYAAKYGRPSLTPGIYFRSLLIGYFEGIGAERGIAWRLADSLALRRFVGIALDEYTPDHSTISRRGGSGGRVLQSTRTLPAYSSRLDIYETSSNDLSSGYPSLRLL
jgi:transposase